MRMYARVAVVATATAVLASPVSATAEHGHVDDQPGDGPPWAANITAMRVFHKENRIAATLRVPVVAKRKLAKTRLKVRSKRSPNRVWTVVVSRNRAGKISDKTLRFKDPGRPPAIVTGCDRRIHSGTGIEKLYISAPRSCMIARGSDEPIRAKGKIAVRHGAHAWILDSTPYTEFLARG